MNKIIRVGVDLAKDVIQVHAVDAAGKVVTNRALKREKFLLWHMDQIDAARREWSPAERFVSGAAQSAISPTVNVQSVPRFKQLSSRHSLGLNKR
jgi:hypothetical protein